MKNSRFYLVLLINVFILGQTVFAQEKKLSLKSKDTNPSETALLWQQTSAEYAALCHQAFNVATKEINRKMELGFGQKPVVIIDLDETIFDNSPYNANLLVDNESYSPDSWHLWTTKAEAALVPGAFEFLNYLKERQMKFIFISNRSEEDLIGTLQNLQKYGFEMSQEDVLLKTTSSFKTSRRNSISDEYEIIMLIGDNLADFHEVFEEEFAISYRKNMVEKFKYSFGERFIILPNLLYGDWEKALEKEDKSEIKNNLKGRLRYLNTH